MTPSRCRRRCARRSFLLSPQTALQDVYGALLAGQSAWGAAAFAAGYGIFWLVAAGLLLQLGEWP